MGVRSAYEQAVAGGVLRRDPAQEAAVAELERVEADLAAAPARRGFLLRRREPPRIKGLYLWGGVGRGKSMLMDLFFRESPVEKKRRVHFHAFMQEVHASLHAARQTGVEDAIVPVADAIVAETRLLCFDEMQITDIADAMIVGRLFKRLFAGGVCVVTTSNRPPEDLYKDGLNRNLFLPFIDMLKANMVIHHLGSETDYRLGRLQGHKSWFSPIDEAAEMAIARAWTELVGRRGEPLVLHRQGREIVLPEFWAGVARASFHDLCGQPLGPGDYLAIAEAVRVLFLLDIPRMGPQNQNEARRFVTLIDALYEARVRLIASAATEPEGLYTEGVGAFEFERTVSRLREMMSADWAREEAEA